jgi:hypothetical protein
MVRGRNQTVYWKESNVTVYERDSDGKEQAVELKDWPSGTGIVQPGTKLYITEGRVKEVGAS